MAVDGLDQVTSGMKLAFETIAAEKTNKAVTLMLIAAGQEAAAITPIDSSNLIDSQHRTVWQTDLGWMGAVYYEAPYAAWVHEMPGTLKGLPRAHFGRTTEGVSFGGGTGKGNYWDPDAEPGFLRKGMTAMAEDAPAILRSVYGDV